MPATPVIYELDAAPEVLRRLAVRFPQRYPILLDSAADGPLSRASILIAEPRASLWLDAYGRLHADGVAPRGEGFLGALENWWLAERIDAPTTQQIFAGGWALFLSYEIAAEIEPKLILPPSRLPWRAFALRAPHALVHERSTDRMFIVTETQVPDTVERIKADIREVEGQDEAPPRDFHVERIEEEAAAHHLERIIRAKEYVRAGDIYQANLSRHWDVHLSRDPDIAVLYDRLRRANPAPFAGLTQWGGATILSSSPERLIRIQGSHVDTRPIAGTRPRSRTPGGDLAERTDLVTHPKERAEHIMLVDLERNDLGRVCKPGSVRVDELMSIESYAHVHHIVSNVSGELRADVTPLGALRAVFPGGTITGCPKFRCMQIIAELERTGRGAYTGSLGFLGRDGTMDMNILIRTMSLVGNRVEIRAGGGIVADSDPQRELEETRAKARGMLAVFDVTDRKEFTG